MNGYTKLLKVQNEEGKRIAVNVTRVGDQVVIVSDPVEALTEEKEKFVSNGRIRITVGQSAYAETIDKLENYLQSVMDEALVKIVKKEKADGSKSTSDRKNPDAGGAKKSSSRSEASEASRKGTDSSVHASS